MTRNQDRRSSIIETLSKCENISDPEQHYAELLEKKARFQNDEEKRSIRTILEALGSSDRILILDALMEKDRCVCELEAIMEKAQASVSHHLKVLEDAGLIKGWKKGKFTHYSLVKPKFERLAEFVTRWINTTKNWFGDIPT